MVPLPQALIVVVPVGSFTPTEAKCLKAFVEDFLPYFFQENYGIDLDGKILLWDRLPADGRLTWPELWSIGEKVHAKLPEAYVVVVSPYMPPQEIIDMVGHEIYGFAWARGK
jgi:hypothetical protein